MICILIVANRQTLAEVPSLVVTLLGIVSPKA
jgi:hypothetical protein